MRKLRGCWREIAATVLAEFGSQLDGFAAVGAIPFFEFDAAILAKLVASDIRVVTFWAIHGSFVCYGQDA